MAAINKPSDINKVWADGGDKVSPSDVKINLGWEVEVPPRQYFNWLDGKQDQAIAHINQHGIPVWDAVTEYQANKSYVQGSNGTVYLAVQTHTNQDPTTDVNNTYWKEAFARAQDTIQDWSSTINYTASDYVIGSNGLIYFALQASGPSTTARNPVSEPTYWQQYASHGIIKFDTAGVTNWTVPLAMQLGIIKPKVTVVGGGGSSSRAAASSGGGGGGGGAAIKVVDLSGVTSVTITVGAGGPSLTADGGGNIGGTSSFGAYCSATGGEGGVLGTGGGGGGVGAGGDLNLAGSGGGATATSAGSTVFTAGAGGGSLLGGGGRGRSTGSAAPGVAGLNGGGGGGSVLAAAGGAGGAGVVIIEW